MKYIDHILHPLITLGTSVRGHLTPCLFFYPDPLLQPLPLPLLPYY